MKLPIAPRPRGATSGAPSDLPTWPPLLATRGPGSRSDRHAHHALHVVMRLDGELRVRAGDDRRWSLAPGVITAADVPHEIDATGGETLLVFVEPESEVGAAIAPLAGASFRLLAAAERDAIDAAPTALEIMTAGGVAWTERLVEILGGPSLGATSRQVHPRIRKLLRHLRTLPADADTSLETLARVTGLSAGRLMHAFTASIGVPLRPYLAWLRLQRAAGAVVSGVALSDAAHAAGFADAAHMTRTFRRMFGTPPSALRPR